MKKTKLMKFTLCSLFSLTLVACGSDSGTTGDNTEKKTDVVTEKTENNVLTIKSAPTKTEYYQYEPISFDGLVVVESAYDSNRQLLSEEEIKDYSLFYSYNGKEVNDKDIILEVGDYEILIKKNGAKQASFPIHVLAARSLTQSITITKAASKTSYLAGDKFSKEGMEVTLKTKTTGKYTKTYTEVIDDYSVVVDGTEVSDNYQFEGAGVYKVEIHYTGWDSKDLSTYFTVTCIPEDTLSKPKNYKDDTITWEKDDTTMTMKITNTGLKTEGKGYYTPEEVINEYNIEDYSEKNIANWKFTPAKGKVPLLVIPVITPGDEALATEENWNMIDKAFFGNSTSLNYESVHSYYYKSSFGQLDFTGGTTGYFSPSTIDARYNKFTGYTEDNVFDLPQIALDWAEKEYHLDLNDYDSNNDGYVDGIWFVYLHKASSANTMTWAFTSSTNAENEDGKKPIANCFGWASIDFINDKFASNTSGAVFKNSACDAHVLIHETGHMLGLKDYYSYGRDSYGYSTNYAPLGEADMMDHNVGDHNPYSKLYLNWITPYVVYGDCEITIPTSQEKNAVIVIPDDTKSIKKDENGNVIFNTMDEYLVLDYYSDKNMNSSDYDCYNVKHVEGMGARIYHVDNRVVNVYQDSKQNYVYELYDDPLTPFKEGNTDRIYKVISNSESGSRAESNYGLPSEADAFDEVRLISAENNLLSTSNPVSNSALFQKGSTFTLDGYRTQFNKAEFNNGKTCSYSISFR